MPEKEEPKKIVLKAAGKGGAGAADKTAPPGGNGISDPMEMRASDTGNMKKMKSAQAAPRGKARKTIKLKPLTPTSQAGSKPDGLEETVSLDREKAQDAMAATPKPEAAPPAAVDDATAKMPRPAKPAAKPPVTPAPAAGDDGTAKMPRPAAPATPAAAGGEDGTAKMPRPAAPVDDATAKMPRPQAAAPQAAPPPVAPQAAPSQSEGSEATAKIPKPVAPAKPGVPGAKQTIKLRPSTASASSDSGAPTAAPTSKSTIKLKPKSDGGQEDIKAEAKKKATIRLMPKKPGAADSPTAQVKHSDPTVSMGEQTAQPAAAAVSPKKPTVKLTPPKGGAAKASPSAPTVQTGVPAAAGPKPSDPTVPAMEDEAAISDTIQDLPVQEKPDEAPPSRGGGTKLKLGVKRKEPPAPPSPDEEGAGPEPKQFADAGAGGGEDPSIIFTLASCFTVAALGYLLFVLFTQFQMLANN